MNKFLIVLLAVCLVSVHAFVKRDAEPPKEKNFLNDAVESLQKSVKEVGAKMSDAFDPEKVQKQFSEFFDSANKAFKDFSSSIGNHNKDDKPQ